MSAQEGRILLLEDRRGLYIPRDFAEEMDHSKFRGYHWSDVEELKRIGNSMRLDPDVWQTYWEIWDHILNNAEHVDGYGYTWHLEQDMDVWLVCPELERKALAERYVASGYGGCPYCGEDIEEKCFEESRPAEADEEHMVRFCSDCNREWTEVFIRRGVILDDDHGNAEAWE